MGSLERRLDALEGRIEPPEDGRAALRRALLITTVDELARLKASRALGFRGSAPIAPKDIPGQYLTKPYTTSELIDLAIKRVWEREELDEELMAPWMRGFKGALERRGYDLEKVEDDGT
jgi:hypothetical protein